MYKKIALYIVLVPPFFVITYAAIWICSEINILPEIFYAYFFKISNSIFQLDSLLWGHGFFILGSLYSFFILSILAIWIYRQVRDHR